MGAFMPKAPVEKGCTPKPPVLNCEYRTNQRGSATTTECLVFHPTRRPIDRTDVHQREERGEWERDGCCHHSPSCKWGVTTPTGEGLREKEGKKTQMYEFVSGTVAQRRRLRGGWGRLGQDWTSCRVTFGMAYTCFFFIYFLPPHLL